MATRSERSGNGGSTEPVGSSADESANASGSPAEAGNADLEELEARLRETADRLTDTAKALGSIASKQVQAHPLAAFGMAFLAGMTFARLMRR